MKSDRATHIDQLASEALAELRREAAGLKPGEEDFELVTRCCAAAAGIRDKIRLLQTGAEER